MEKDSVRELIQNSYLKYYGVRGASVMLADLIFRIGNVWFAERNGLHTNTWLYRFDYETAFMRRSKLHAFHSTDMVFFFGNYNKGLGKLVFFKADKKEALRVAKEIQNDLAGFARTGTLPWAKAAGANVPAKCYDVSSYVEEAVPNKLKAVYADSEFKRRSISGAGLGFNKGGSANRNKKR